MVILDLVAAVGALAEGQSVSVAADGAGEVEVARAWCQHTGNTFVDEQDGYVRIRRGRRTDPLDQLPPDRRPGARLWMYTNFDCNLACDYCCVRSSPRTPRRALGLPTIERLAAEAPQAGVVELLLTGGEPFLLPDLEAIVAACASALPTTLLTNGMLFHGRRLERLRAMDRRVILQISLDSPTPDRHDSHRGAGSWLRAMAGIRTAIQEGFRVKVAATLVTDDLAEAKALQTFLDGLGIEKADQILRPLAKRGEATEGVNLTTETLLPEVTVTADGIYWHPVGADDDDQHIDASIFPLDQAIARVQDLYRDYHRHAEDTAQAFPCA